MLGSISNAVAAKAQCPVLVIKQPPLVPLRWRRVLAATGGSPWSDAAVDHAIELARVQQLEVCLLYVDQRRSRRMDSLFSLTSDGKNVLALAEARAAVQSGRSEIELLGQTVNAYRCPKNGRDFGALLSAVADIHGVARLRFMTSHPAVVNDSMIAAMRDHSNISRYLHLPVQSGSSRVLQHKMPIQQNRLHLREQRIIAVNVRPPRLHHPNFRIGAYTVGGARDLVQNRLWQLALGADVTFYSKPPALSGAYGDNPVSFQIFVRIRPGSGKHHHMR